jgi:hypothetical protein
MSCSSSEQKRAGVSASADDSPLCAAEARDLSLLTGGDWSQETNSPLLFLQRGFRELIKCRQVLKGSFPMSFYMIEDPPPVHHSRWK